MVKKAKVSEKRSAARDRVIITLRQQIADGGLAPGTRLPIRSSLENRFKVSHVTMQRAIDTLMRDGFIQSRGKLGTFVTESPPFLHNYALAFPFHPGSTHWNKFWTALAHEAVVLQQSGDLKIPLYYNVLEGDPSSGHYQALVRDIREHRLGGIIFSSSPHLLEHTPLLDHPGIPRVATAGNPQRFPMMWTVGLDANSFVNKAFDYLAGRGRKRIAILSVPGLMPHANLPDYFAASAEAHGLTLRECWRQYVAQSAPKSSQNIIQLLLDGPAGTRPDAVLIADDNLLESATAGFLKAGVRLGEDIDVVAHANFPIAGSSGLPIKMLGYDARDVLARCVEAIDRQRAGEREQQHLKVEAVWG